MGFIARTIFWLGLVYSAMPLDFGSLPSGPAPSLAGANPLTPCAQGPTGDCRWRFAGLRKALDAAAALDAITTTGRKQGVATDRPGKGPKVLPRAATRPQ